MDLREQQERLPQVVALSDRIRDTCEGEDVLTVASALCYHVACMAMLFSDSEREALKALEALYGDMKSVIRMNHPKGKA